MPKKDITEILTSSARENEKTLVTQNGKEVGDITDLLNSGVMGDGTIPPTRKASDYLKSAVGWVYGCVNAIGDEVGMIDLHLYSYNGSGVKEIFDSPILDLLYRPNSFTTKFNMLS